VKTNFYRQLFGLDIDVTDLASPEQREQFLANADPKKIYVANAITTVTGIGYHVANGRIMATVGHMKFFQFALAICVLSTLALMPIWLPRLLIDGWIFLLILGAFSLISYSAVVSPYQRITRRVPEVINSILRTRF
jgi:hypothetical protein